MQDFPHLEFRSAIIGDFKGPSGGSLTEISKKNKGENRRQHAEYLKSQISIIKQNWEQNLKIQKEKFGNEVVENSGISIFLQIDPNNLSPDFLFGLGIEVISEEEDGFVICAASLADLNAFEEKVNRFEAKEGSEKVAELLQIENGNGWRPNRILSDHLRSIWDQIKDNQIFVVDLGISCFIPLQNFTSSQPSSKQYQRSIRKFEASTQEVEAQRLELMDERLDLLLKFLRPYRGELLSSAIDLRDSFSQRIRVNGSGLKDLVLNFPYLFDVSEPEDLELEAEGNFEGQIENTLILNPPDGNASKIGIIDSGIQENHRFIAPAILSLLSKNYVDSSQGVEDLVDGGGHGTRVSGTVLFHEKIQREGSIKLPFWIANAKILNSDNKLPKDFPIATKIQEIVDKLGSNGVRIFNHSLGTYRGFNPRHMSVWGAVIDKLSFERDVLFLISAGNIPTHGHQNSSGIIDFLNRSIPYPEYLLAQVNRVCNPAHSIFGLTVGSLGMDGVEIQDHSKFSDGHQISSFSRTGLGIWNSIKPDVVEVGGDWTLANGQFIKRPEVIPETIRSTYHGGPAIGRDAIGSSFATPKVTHIAGHLQNLFQGQTSLFIKGLIIQSARWPQHCQNHLALENLRMYGYGIPDLERASSNNQNRITFGASNSIQPKKAHLYSVKIPDSISRAGLTNQILIEVTLVYTSQPRRTRKGLRGYLGNLCEFDVSGRRQSFKQFYARTVQEVNFEGSTKSDGSFKWAIGNKKSKDGLINGISRKWSANQKDWAIVPAYDLPSELSIAVICRQGWDKDLRVKSNYSLFVSIEDLGSQLQIYQEISLANRIEVEPEIQL